MADSFCLIFFWIIRYFCCIILSHQSNLFYFLEFGINFITSSFKVSFIHFDQLSLIIHQHFVKTTPEDYINFRFFSDLKNSKNSMIGRLLFDHS